MLVLAAATPAAAQGVHVALTPATVTVAPGGQFDLDLTVTPAGASFNGFDATVGFNPAVLTFQPTSPTSLQQGCLMTGACSAACGNTFHRFSAAGDSAAISDVLLCNQIALTGPGQVYRLHFQASNTPQTTVVSFLRATFYNAGVYVTPVVTANAQINIGSNVAVDPPGPPRALSLAAEPNPTAQGTVFALAAASAGPQRLTIHDLAGRLIRVVDQGWHAAGTRRVAWDGRDAAGLAVPSGIYLATLGAGTETTRIRVAVLR